MCITKTKERKNAKKTTEKFMQTDLRRRCCLLKQTATTITKYTEPIHTKVTTK